MAREAWARWASSSAGEVTSATSPRCWKSESTEVGMARAPALSHARRAHLPRDAAGIMTLAMASDDTAPERRRFRLGGRRWLRFLLIVAGIVSLLVAAGGAVAALWAFTILPRTLPSVTALETFQPLVGTKIYDDNDELITELHVERRIFVPLAHIPQSLRDAVIATEDKRFYYHWGIDPIGIARAVAQNYRRGRIVEGGSTITQQLTKA